MKRKHARKIWFIIIVLLALTSACLLTFNTLKPNYQSNQSQSAPEITPNTIPTATVQGITTVDSHSEWSEIYFTNPTIPFDKITTGGVEERLIEKINNANVSIDGAVFEFDLDNVSLALINAMNRGVTVRLVYDNEYTDTDPQMQKMRSSGINVVPDDRSAYMHNKFFVIDGQCVWTGSFNLTINAAYKNNENAFYLCAPEMVQNYKTEFQEMFSSQFGATSPSDTPHSQFYVGDILIENYFAPEDDVMSYVISSVAKAKESVHFMAYSLTDDDLGQTMIERKLNGVEVGGIFEAKNASTDSSECNRLLNNNIPVTLDGNPATFHHKVIIIDGEVVIFGSFNFTANANESNDENLLIVHDSGLAQKFESEYQKRLSESKEPVNGVCKSK